MSHKSDLIATDIDAYLAQHERKELLRFITCGSVDDGKSTLIGRLLYDSKMLYEDQIAQLEDESRTQGTTGGGFDPALVTDGLKAEREQGITIDVAYGCGIGSQHIGNVGPIVYNTESFISIVFVENIGLG